MSVFSDGFILDGVLEKTKSYVDVPDVGARFSDSWIISHEISSALTDVLHRVSHWASDEVLLSYDITTVVNQKDYVLPPAIRSITRLVAVDAQGNEIGQSLPRHRDHPLGFDWEIQGNSIVFENNPSSVETYRIYYLPMGDIALHSDSSTGATLASEVWSLPSSVDLGSVDRRALAYCGHLLRVKPSTGPIEERIITSHAWDTDHWEITTRNAFSSLITDTAHPYEIVPWGVSSLWECVAVRAAVRLGSKLSLTQKDMKYLVMEYQSSLKTAFETHQHMQGRRGSRLRTDSVLTDTYNYLPRT